MHISNVTSTIVNHSNDCNFIKWVYHFILVQIWKWCNFKMVLLVMDNNKYFWKTCWIEIIICSGLFSKNSQLWKILFRFSFPQVLCAWTFSRCSFKRLLLITSSATIKVTPSFLLWILWKQKSSYPIQPH